MRTRRSALAVVLLALLLTAQSGVTVFAHTCRMMRQTTVSLDAPAHHCGGKEATDASHDGPSFDRACCQLDHATLDLRLPVTQHPQPSVPVVAVAILPELSLDLLGLRLPAPPAALTLAPNPPDPLPGPARLPLLGIYRI